MTCVLRQAFRDNLWLSAGVARWRDVREADRLSGWGERTRCSAIRSDDPAASGLVRQPRWRDVPEGRHRLRRLLNPAPPGPKPYAALDSHPVGWRERDWAKWTDAERRRFYGTTRATSHPPTRSSLTSSGKRHTRREALAALILIAAAVVYYSGAFNHSHQRTFTPVSGPVPTPYLRLPQTSPPSQSYSRMSGPS